MRIDAFEPIRITQVFASRKSIQQCRSFRHAWGRDIEPSAFWKARFWIGSHKELRAALISRRQRRANVAAAKPRVQVRNSFARAVCGG